MQERAFTMTTETAAGKIPAEAAGKTPAEAAGKAAGGKAAAGKTADSDASKTNAGNATNDEVLKMGANSAASGAASKADAGGTAGDAPKSDATHDMPADELLYDLADLFRLFADTTRIKILYALMGGEKSVAALAEAVGVSQSAASHQLRNLRQAHLVKFDRAGKQAIYALSDDHVHTMLEQGMTHICE